MARILYGITGEGLGHTMRARVVLPHLVAAGHRVLVAASSRASGLFAALGYDVAPIEGLSIRYEDGAVQRLETLARVVRRAPHALARNVGVGLEAALDFAPDLVISDFDSFAYAVGRAIDRPVVSFDHHHVITRFRHPRAVLDGTSYDFSLTRALVSRKMPYCDRWLVSSFYFPEPSAPATTLFGPVVRPEIEHVEPTTGEHVLVYQTAAGDPRLEAALRAVPEIPFRVYGLGARAAAGNLTFHPFDEASFVRDLASSRAVIANGGFMTLAEAAFLGKPVLSCPIRHQGEQELNAAWLAHLGLGLRCRRIAPDDVRRIARFVPRRRVRSGTRDALRAFDRTIAELW